MKTLIPFLFIALLACTKIDKSPIVNLNNGKIDIIGHGGSGFTSLLNPLPTNSFNGITNATDALNTDGVEVDAQMSKDHEIILYHDATLEKSTNCSGCVTQTNSIDITNCTFKNDYNAHTFKEFNVTTLRQVFDHYKGRSKKPKIYIEDKIYLNCLDGTSDSIYINQFASLLSNLIGEFNVYNSAIVYSGDTSLLNKVKSQAPGIQIYYNAQSFPDALDICTNNNYPGMVISNSNISKDQVTEAHNNNIKVTIWYITIQKEIVEAANKNPDALMTDNIVLTEDVVKKRY